MEMVFAASEGSKSLSGEKRKKGELEVGEVWRAKNVSREWACEERSIVGSS